ncbi:hypothetical protein [Clostridium sp. D33t1_170424_F3]|uniref:hypothetical protein n=1 Tax=Clostridium sp. D33t1_170424_F3 TaxID=2787099 RepID=UPI0018A8BD43|nr:hypothetical protein [Clostridium sp. D33t1_170424_F3]
MEEKKRSRKGLVAVVIVLAVLIGGVGVTAGLALSDPYADAVSAGVQPDTTVRKLMDAVLTGDPVMLTRDEVNGLIAEKLAALPAEGIQLLDLQCVSTKEGCAEFYAPVSFRGLRLPLSARLELGCDGEGLWANVQSVHLGRLPVPPQWMLEAVKSAAPPEVSVEDERISMPASFFDENILGGSVGLTVQSLSVTDTGFLVDVAGNLDRLEEGIRQKLSDFLRGSY